MLAQLLLKHGMRDFDVLHKGQSFLLREFSLVRDPFVLGALLSYGVGFAIHSLVISRIELSKAYAAPSVTTVVIISAITMVFLKEVLSTVKFAGSSFCILGIFMVL